MVRRRGWTALLAVGCLALLAACSSPGPYPYLDVRVDHPAARRANPSCPRDGVGLGSGDADRAAPTPGTLPAGFAAHLVRRCLLGDEPSTTPDGPLRRTVTEQTSPVTPALLAALMLPDQRFDPRDHAACAAVAHSPVYMLLLDRAGHAYRPYLPADPCQEPRPEVVAALADLHPATSTTYTVEEPR